MPCLRARLVVHGFGVVEFKELDLRISNLGGLDKSKEQRYHEGFSRSSSFWSIHANGRTGSRFPSPHVVVFRARLILQYSSHRRQCSE